MTIVKALSVALIVAVTFIAGRGLLRIFRQKWQALKDLSARTARPDGDHFILDRDRH